MNARGDGAGRGFRGPAGALGGLLEAVGSAVWADWDAAGEVGGCRRRFGALFAQIGMLPGRLRVPVAVRSAVWAHWDVAGEVEGC